jgi:hypothetical protein
MEKYKQILANPICDEPQKGIGESPPEKGTHYKYHLRERGLGMQDLGSLVDQRWLNARGSQGRREERA